MGCDYREIATPEMRARYFDAKRPMVDPPHLPGCEVHVHRDELAAAKTRLDVAVFADEIADTEGWHLQEGEYSVAPGVHAIASAGHTAGHMSLFVELPDGRPVILCGDPAWRS